MTRPAAWPPPLPEDMLLERWRPSHAADLTELRTAARLDPIEGLECVVKNLETGKRQIVLQLRPAPALRTAEAAPAPTRPASTRDASSSADVSTRRAPLEVDASPAEPGLEFWATATPAQIEARVLRAVTALRERWTHRDVDAIALELELQELMPGRAHLALVDGRARAFERLGPDPRTGRPRWRSMYVFTAGDVRRFAEGATR